jgi:deoxyadenosine/deoxycytidine kinase
MYIVEGNIGVGKSTFLNIIKEQCSEVDVVFEPHDVWEKNVAGQTILDNFYKDPVRWSYTMETFTMVRRVKDYAEEQQHRNPYRILERSIFSGHYCFAYNGFAEGYFTKEEWDAYNLWVTFLIQERCQPPLGFIYLQANPETCFKRIQKRSRFCEKGLKIDLLHKLDHYHTQFLIQKKNVFPELKSVPILVLDCNEEFEKNTTKMKEHVGKVKAFMKPKEALNK